MRFNEEKLVYPELHYAGGHCFGLGFADRHYVTEFCANGRQA